MSKAAGRSTCPWCKRRNVAMTVTGKLWKHSTPQARPGQGFAGLMRVCLGSNRKPEDKA